MRYITRSAKPLYIETPLWDDSEPSVPSLEVPEHIEEFTGLLDSKGDKIWRQPNPMGFGRDEEW